MGADIYNITNFKRFLIKLLKLKNIKQMKIPLLLTISSHYQNAG